MDKILDTLKVQLGVPLSVDSFDSELLIYLNSVVLNLIQMGLCDQLEILADTEWTELIGVYADMEAVKTYMYLKVKLFFDPPQSYVLNAIQNQIQELEWRLVLQKEGGTNE